MPFPKTNGLNSSLGPLYVLRLYVAGHEANSQLARENLRLLCDEYLKDRSLIEEVDVLQDPSSAFQYHILVTPTLVMLKPGPPATVVGNLADKDRVLKALRLKG